MHQRLRPASARPMRVASACPLGVARASTSPAVSPICVLPLMLGCYDDARSCGPAGSETSPSATASGQFDAQRRGHCGIAQCTAMLGGERRSFPLRARVELQRSGLGLGRSRDMLQCGHLRQSRMEADQTHPLSAHPSHSIRMAMAIQKATKRPPISSSWRLAPANLSDKSERPARPGASVAGREVGRHGCPPSSEPV